MKHDENIYEGFFVFFMSFLVKLLLGCGRRLCCVLG